MNRLTATATMIPELESNIPSLMADQNVPGLAITLLQDGQLHWSQTFGVRNVETGDPITTDTVFEAASLSKPLFAYLVLKMCEAGQLDLDKPLADYLSKPYLDDDARLQQITVRHVLSHTPGFPNWRPQGQPLLIHLNPGERFSYSGEGYMYLQAVVEEVLGRDLVEYVWSEVLQPLGMHHSRFVWDGTVDLPIAVGHNGEGEPREKHLWSDMYAAASLHSTPQDYARFLCMILRPRPDNPLHLHPDTIKRMLTPQIAVNDSFPWEDDWPRADVTLNESVSWGLGWGLQKLPAGDTIWHWGDNGNYRAFVIAEPATGNGLVIMTNGRKGQQVINHILREQIGGNYPSLDWVFGSA